MANPFLVLGGIAISVATAAFGILQVPGWVAGAQDAAAINDVAQIAEAQAASLSQSGSYTTGTVEGVTVTPSSGTKTAFAVSPDGGRWGAVAVSQSGRVFIRTSASSKLFTSDRTYAAGESIAGAPKPAGVTVGGTAAAPTISVVDGPVLGDWVESRNTIPTPNPTVYQDSTWRTLGRTIESDPDGGLYATFLEQGTLWTPYVFSGLSTESYRAGDKVTLSMTYRIDSVTGSDMEEIRASAHERSTNHYFSEDGAFTLRPIVIGQVERVTLHFVAPRTIAANDLDIAIVGSKQSGSLPAVVASIRWLAREAVIERGHTAGTFYDGDSPSDNLTRHRWEGTPGSSVSIRETRQEQ